MSWIWLCLSTKVKQKNKQNQKRYHMVTCTAPICLNSKKIRIKNQINKDNKKENDDRLVTWCSSPSTTTVTAKKQKQKPDKQREKQTKTTKKRQRQRWSPGAPHPPPPPPRGGSRPETKTKVVWGYWFLFPSRLELPKTPEDIRTLLLSKREQVTISASFVF